MVAGWDFSQYFGSGFLTEDGVSFRGDLDANYSNFDPSFGAGKLGANELPPGSDAFGTMYIDGQFGSTDVVPGSGEEAFVPSAAAGGSLQSNVNAGVPGSSPFESFSVLSFEGQTFTNELAMTAADTVDVVFEADLTSVDVVGREWAVSFAGKTFSGIAPVGVEFSHRRLELYELRQREPHDLRRSLPGGAGPGAGRTRLRALPLAAPLDGGVNQALLDNVAIHAVPEPGTLLLVGAGLVGLALRRRAQVV